MKKIILSLTLFCASFQAHAFTVDAGQIHDPLVIQLVGSSKGYEQGTFYKDSQGNSRLYYFFGYNATNCDVVVYSSFGVEIDNEYPKNDTCTSLHEALSTVSPRTPVTITIDRTSLKIISVKATADYLSSAEMPDNEG